MIYKDILTNGRGYGKPHVTKLPEPINGYDWIAHFRGCYSCGTTPSDAAADVLAYYDECFPGAR